MIIIGEKINGSIPSVKQAIEERNEDLRIFDKKIFSWAAVLDLSAALCSDPVCHGIFKRR